MIPCASETSEGSRPKKTELFNFQDCKQGSFKLEASKLGAALLQGRLYSFSILTKKKKKVSEVPQHCVAGKNLSKEEKSKFAGKRSRKLAKEQVRTAPTWVEPRERKRQSHKA
jgi:hypothetical protein